MSKTDSEVFATGSRRDSEAGKPRLQDISPWFLERMGEHLRSGAEKYGDGNFEKGQPMRRVIGSLLRHVNAYHMGKDDEDHLAAAACNVMFLIHFEESIKRGILPPELDDRPLKSTELN